MLHYFRIYLPNCNFFITHLSLFTTNSLLNIRQEAGDARHVRNQLNDLALHEFSYPGYQRFFLRGFRCRLCLYCDPRGVAARIRVRTTREKTSGIQGRVLVAQWIERPPGGRKAMGSNPIETQIFSRSHACVTIFFTYIYRSAISLGSITSRCSGKEPALLPRILLSLI